MIGTILGAIGSFFGSLLKAAWNYAALGIAYLSGRRAAKSKQDEKNAEIKDKQSKIGAREPKDRREVLDRMKKKKL